VFEPGKISTNASVEVPNQGPGRQEVTEITRSLAACEGVFQVAPY